MSTTTLAKCTRIGCGASFDPKDPSGSNEASCTFHPGKPVFHDGLKSWSCCKDQNKPVLEFDQFLAIPGCATGSHSVEKQDSTAAPSAANLLSAQQKTSTQACSSNGIKSSSQTPLSTTPTPSKPVRAPTAQPKSRLTRPTPFVINEANDEPDDPKDAELKEGMRCKRKGCKAVVEPGQTETDKWKNTQCRWHPGDPIFHEGSKGYTCCKRRVLEFDEFLNIEGCKSGKRHAFIGKQRSPDQEDIVDLRMDHYQTPDKVIASVFGKQADKDRSSVTFTEQEMTVDLHLPDKKRFNKTIALYGFIDPSKSTYRIGTVKCEITLVKADGLSWPVLESDHAALGGAITFSAPKLG